MCKFWCAKLGALPGPWHEHGTRHGRILRSQEGVLHVRQYELQGALQMLLALGGQGRCLSLVFMRFGANVIHILCRPALLICLLERVACSFDIDHRRVH